MALPTTTNRGLKGHSAQQRWSSKFVAFVTQTFFIGGMCILAFTVMKQLSATTMDEQEQQAGLLVPVSTVTGTNKNINPKRTRLKESVNLQDLKHAYERVENLIQPPLGQGTSPKDPTLNPYSLDLRGTDMTLPENDVLRSNRIIYMITPTYKRRTQMVDLTRVSQTLRLAKESGYHERLYWILLEDADFPSHRIRHVAIQSGISFAHVSLRTPYASRTKFKAHRGLEQRNRGLDLVEEIGAEGVVYFLDDDNAYHVQLFHELAYTTHVSVFGTGLPGGSAYERCRVDPNTGKVEKLLTTWEAPRTFPIDMAGFAFATHHLARTKAAGKKMRFSQDMLPGYLENDLISFAAGTVTELQPLAANCTRILAWHVKTVGNEYYYNPEEGVPANPKSSPKFEFMTRLV